MLVSPGVTGSAEEVGAVEETEVVVAGPQAVKGSPAANKHSGIKVANERFFMIKISLFKFDYNLIFKTNGIK